MTDAIIDIQPPQRNMPSKNLAGMQPINDNLPQIPFYVGIIGPRHSGKSVLLYNLLSDRPGMYGHSFKKNNIIVFSPTRDKDPTLQGLKLKNVYGPNDDPGFVIQSVRNQQDLFNKSDNLTGVLMVFDDITQTRDAWEGLEALSYFGRHDHIHVLYVAHKMSSIRRGIRTQTQQWILYKPHEESERQWIMDMFSRKRTQSIWESAMTRVWNVPYNFIYIDFECKEISKVYREGFNKPLFTQAEESFMTGDGEANKTLNTDILNK